MIIEIFEPSLCCTSGVCGPEPDKTLIELQNTIQVLSKAMVEVKRYAINQVPLAFTGNLDPALSEEIMNILNEINQKQKTTIIRVTHSPAAANYGNVKIHLHEGRLIEQTVHDKVLIA